MSCCLRGGPKYSIRTLNGPEYLNTTTKSYLPSLCANGTSSTMSVQWIQRASLENHVTPWKAIIRRKTNPTPESSVMTQRHLFTTVSSYMRHAKTTRMLHCEYHKWPAVLANRRAHSETSMFLIMLGGNFLRLLMWFKTLLTCTFKQITCASTLPGRYIT